MLLRPVVFPGCHSPPRNLSLLCVLRLRTVGGKSSQEDEAISAMCLQLSVLGGMHAALHMICVCYNWAVEQKWGVEIAKSLPQSISSLIVVVKPVWVKSLPKANAFQSSKKEKKKLLFTRLNSAHKFIQWIKRRNKRVPFTLTVQPCKCFRFGQFFVMQRNTLKAFFSYVCNHSERYRGGERQADLLGEI